MSWLADRLWIVRFGEVLSVALLGRASLDRASAVVAANHCAGALARSQRGADHRTPSTGLR